MGNISECYLLREGEESSPRLGESATVPQKPTLVSRLGAAALAAFAAALLGFALRLRVGLVADPSARASSRSSSSSCVRVYFGGRAGQSGRQEGREMW
jgi:hypothetical protein